MAKQTVLLVHSGGFTSRQWRRLAELLAPDYRVLAPDLLGYGSGAPWPDGEPFHFRQDLAFLESLIGDEGEPVHVVGHSYGGFLALQLALVQPELVRSIAVYDPVAFGILDAVEDAGALRELEGVRRQWEPDASGADEAWLAGFVDWWNGAGSWTRLPEETRAAFRAMGWKVFQEVMSLTADRTDGATYAKIMAPTLVMGGGNSPLTEQRVVERLGAAVPHATVRFFDGAGHMGPVSHASVVNAAIEEFLRVVC
jgi:pimeloyl-ACP methyl ester carboxylesterase